MPRDANGNMTLPAGNPVVTDTLITSVWANTTMGDLRNEMTDSLSRSGKGAMLASLGIVDGTKTSPGLNGASEPTSGLYRAGDGDWRFSILDTDIAQWTSAGQMVQVTNTTQSRALKDHLGAFVTPEMFTGDDDAKITAAVADGRAIWCEKQYTLTANVAGFHSAKWMGPGSIKFGTSTWLVAPYGPSQDRFIYLDPAGDDNNMGLDSTNAVKTLAAALAIIGEYREDIKGGFILEHAAGTYTEGANFPNGRTNPRRILLRGPAVSGGVPTAIYDGTSATNQRALYFQDRVYFEVQDIKFQNWRQAEAGTGIYAANRAVLIIDNVHCDNCDYGIRGNVHTRVIAYGGVFNNNGRGLRASDSCILSVRQDSFGNTPTFTGNVYAIDGKEHCMLSVDHANIYDSITAGIDASRWCRTILRTAVDFQRNAVGVRDFDSVTEDVAPANWNLGGANKNVIDYIAYGASRMHWDNLRGPAVNYRLVEGIVINHTGVTVRTLLWDSSTTTNRRNDSITWSLRPNTMTLLGRSLRLRIRGRILGTAGSKTFEVVVGPYIIATYTVPGATFNTYDYSADLMFNGVTPGAVSQRVFETFLANAIAPYLNETSRTDDYSIAGPFPVQIYMTLSDAADTVQIRGVEISETG